MSDEPIQMCVDCETGFYHNYNGVWLCQFCGQPKEKEPVQLPANLTDQNLVKPATRTTTTRKGRKTDE